MKSDEILKIHGETYMENFKLCVPCLLGLEGPIADELRRMKMQDIQNENGRVYFTGGAKEIAKANINLRIGERVLLETVQSRDLRRAFRAHKGAAMGDDHPEGRGLPRQGVQPQFKAFFGIRLPEDHKEGDSRAPQERLRS